MIYAVNNMNYGSSVSFKQMQLSPMLRQMLSARSANPLQTKDTFEKQKPDSKNALSIFYYNDTHGNMDQIAGLINGAKNFLNTNMSKPHFVLSAGDNCSGGDPQKNSLFFNIMQDLIGVNASAIGNHEIDASKEGFLEALKDNKIPFIATNVEFENDELKNLVKKSAILESNGVKYGFVGAMPLDFKLCTKETVQEGVNVDDFDDTVEHLQEEIDKLKQQGVDKIILLSHTSHETDKLLAKNLDGVDIIIGGHSHTVVDGAKEGENLVKSKSGEPVIITQAGENGKYYGNLDVEFDDEGRIIRVKNTLTTSNNREKTPIIEHIKDSVLGKSQKIANITQIDPMPENRRKAPSGWTCMVADSMREEMGVDVALVNSANIRKVPKIGTLTERDILESMPMKNKLLKTKVTQKQLVDAIRNASKQTFSSQNGEPGLLQGSGFGYKIDDKGKLLEMYMIDASGNKMPIDIENPSDEITYTAVYDSFVAQKGGETPELEPRFPVEEFDYDKDKTMTDYLLKMQNSKTPQVEQTLENPDKKESKPRFLPRMFNFKKPQVAEYSAAHEKQETKSVLLPKSSSLNNIEVKYDNRIEIVKS